MAGLFTVVGGFLAIHKRMANRGALACALGFAAGAMILVSFAEILPASLASLGKDYNGWAPIVAYTAFFGGMLIVAVIDKLLPQSLNPSEYEGAEDNLSRTDTRYLLRGGLLVAAAIGLHNVPEGLVTFVATLQDPQLGLTLAIAIAIHNVPEGIAVAAPVYAATKSRRKALAITATSGIAEPIGALAGYVILGSLLPESLMGALFAAVGGMMVFICLDELLPAARRYQTSNHQTIYAVILGMAVMALSLILLS